MNTVPCTSGCGVTSHIAGSVAAATCGRRSGGRFTAAVPIQNTTDRFSPASLRRGLVMSDAQSAALSDALHRAGVRPDTDRIQSPRRLARELSKACGVDRRAALAELRRQSDRPASYVAGTIVSEQPYGAPTARQAASRHI